MNVWANDELKGAAFKFQGVQKTRDKRLGQILHRFGKGKYMKSFKIAVKIGIMYRYFTQKHLKAALVECFQCWYVKNLFRT